MTTAELITLVRTEVGEDTAGQISDAQILAFLNKRQKELASDCNVLVSAWTASTVASQQQYSVPSEYTSVEAIRIYRTTGDNAKEWLMKVWLEELDPNKGTGTPLKFARWGLNVSGNNSPAFWLDPIPNSSGSSDIECYGRQLPATMVSGGQGPEVRDRWQYAIVDGAAANVFLRWSVGDAQFLPLYDRYQAMWLSHKREAENIEIKDLSRPGSGRDSMGYVRGWRG